MKCAITGSSGFIGSHLAEELEKRGHMVLGFDTKPAKWNKIPTIIGDVTKKADVERALKDADFVFHLAGMLGTHELVDNAIAATKVNVVGTLNVLEACKKFGVKMIEISKPNCWVNTYTITKVAAETFTEMYRREHGVEAATVKWFNVYGGRQPLEEEAGYKKFIPTSIVHALKGEPIEIYGNGEQTMDLVHTTDTVVPTIKVMENWDVCEGITFEIGSGVETTVNETAEMIKKLTNSTSKIKHIPMRKGEWDNTHIKADLKKINLLTGWMPEISLEKGLMESIEWYKNYYYDELNSD